MTARRKRPPVPRIALNRQEAAAALGMSIGHFERYVQPELRVIRSGRLRLYRVRDLEKWAEENAALTLDPSHLGGGR